MAYGLELVLDLSDCNVNKFNRSDIGRYFTELCALIGMEACDLHFWDEIGVPQEERQTNPKTIGTSAVQFILTSSVVIHSLDKLRAVYVNVFSCKDFNSKDAATFTANFFEGTIEQCLTIQRK